MPPCPPAAPRSMVASISAEVAAWLPRKQASIMRIPALTGTCAPVASPTASASAISDAAAAKSPRHTAPTASVGSRIGSWSSAPTSRASWTCLAVRHQPSSSHKISAAALASLPQRSISAAGMSALAKALVACRSTGAAAVGPSVTSSVRPSSRRSARRGGCVSAGRARAARDTSSRSPPAATCLANIAASQASR